MQVKKLFIALILGLGLTLSLVLALSTVEGWLLGGGLLGGGLSVVRAVDIGVQTYNDGVAIDGKCMLREAIIAANTNAPVDTCAAGGADDNISLKTATYVLTVTGTGDDLGLTGDLDITDTLTIEGVGPGNTIIDASGVISDRVFDIQVGAGMVVISGVTIINGNVTGDGGGIRSRAANLTLINVEVISNAASTSGGGVYVYQGSATLNGGQILSNTADSMGGGVFAQECSAALSGTNIFSNTANDGGGLYILSGSVTLNGGQILSNTASYGGGVCVAGFAASGDGVFTQTGDSIIAYNIAGNRGGGVYVNDAEASATLNDGQILSNTADYGGGVYVWGGSVTLSGGQIVRNTASDGSGGGVSVWGGSAVLNGGQILSNAAHYDGGGLSVAGGSSLALNDGQIFGNTAERFGGGMYVDGSATLSGGQVVSNTANGLIGRGGGGIYHRGGTLALLNTTVSRNRATTGGGGGIWNYNGTSVLTCTTIASNTAAAGGGGIHWMSGTISLQNSIVAHNGAANCAGTLTSNGHNLDSGTTCGFTASGDITGTDPLLGPLVEDGGTLVHPLLEGSPAIDAGVCVAGITTDQRGVTRPQGAGCDIGAYEWAWYKIYLPLVLNNYQ